jgi:hypothetical protein
MARIGGERTPTRNLGGMSVRDPGRTADSPRMLLAIERVGVAGPRWVLTVAAVLSSLEGSFPVTQGRGMAGPVPLRPSEVAIALALPPAARGSAGLSSRRPGLRSAAHPARGARPR